MGPPANNMQVDLDLAGMIAKGAAVEIWRPTKEELILIANESGLAGVGAVIWECRVKWEPCGIYDVPGKLSKKLDRRTFRSPYGKDRPTRYCLSISKPTEERFESRMVWP